MKQDETGLGTLGEDESAARRPEGGSRAGSWRPEKSATCCTARYVWRGQFPDHMKSRLKEGDSVIDGVPRQCPRG